jgi:hypothetical protein
MDPIQIVHLVTIMNEPDVWTVDLAGARGKHRLDLGPTFSCRLPIFASVRRWRQERWANSNSATNLSFSSLTMLPR